MWWPESSLILTLGKSRDYQCLLLLCYGGLCGAVFQAAVSWGFKSVALCLLLAHAYCFLRTAKPTGALQLKYQGSQWYWWQAGHWIGVDRVRLWLSMSRCAVLQLQVERRQVNYVIFRDQVEQEQWQRLMWLTHGQDG